MLKYFTYSQKIWSFFVIFFLVMAACPLDEEVRNMWLVGFIAAISLLIAGTIFLEFFCEALPPTPLRNIFRNLQTIPVTHP